MRNGALSITGREIIIDGDRVYVNGAEILGDEANRIRGEIATRSKKAIAAAFGGSSQGIPRNAITIQHSGKIVNIIGEVISTNDGKLRLASSIR